MKLILYLLLVSKLLIFLSFMQSSYEVIDWTEATEIVSQPGCQFIMTLEGNLCSVFRSKEGTYIVRPVNPFAKSLKTKNRQLLDRWILDDYFPTNESENFFYFENREEINRIPQKNAELLNELFSHTGKDSKILDNPNEIDEVYSLLKRRRTFNKYKLHFIVLVGTLIINRHPKENHNWSILKSKQMLNPLIEIVLSKTIRGEERYFNIQDLVIGKWGYRGIRDIEVAYTRKWVRPNEINTLEPRYVR